MFPVAEQLCHRGAASPHQIEDLFRINLELKTDIRIIRNLLGYQTMQLEDYFNFLAPNDIRIQGTRIGIETILYDYIFRARTAEEIAQTWTSLSLEQIYATILYYLHNQAAVHQYMTDWIEHGERMCKEQEENPSPLILRLRKLKQEKMTGENAQVSI